MKIKTLIFSAALLAGIRGAQAQGNILGYAAVTVPSGFSLMANPLSSGLTNGANEIGLLIEGEIIHTWNGTGFDSFSYDPAAGGWLDAQSQPAAPPMLPPGQGFFFFNPGPPTNVVFSGRISPGPGSTIGMELPSGYSLLASLVPAAVNDISSAPVNLPLVDDMLVLTWAGSTYVSTSYDHSIAGWVDANLVPKPAPSYSIGQSFFVFNPGPALAWNQTLP
jgi:hypothetical protein